MQKAQQRKHGQVLIVDDTAFNIEIMQLMIEVNFPQVVCESATSGMGAIEKVHKRL